MNYGPTFKIADGTPYRPSNGTEGELFMSECCYRCKRDQAYQESGGEAEGCPIIAASMAYKPSDPQYPKEWVWQGGEAICTAFDDITERLTNEERAAQLHLQLEAA